MKRTLRRHRKRLISIAWMIVAFIILAVINAYVFYFRKGTSIRSLLTIRQKGRNAAVATGATLPGLKTDRTADSQNGAAESEERWIEDMVYEGESLDHALRRRVVDAGIRRAITTALQHLYDLKTVRAGHRFSLHTNLEGEIRGFDYRVSPILAFHLTCSASPKNSHGCAWQAQKIEVPLETKVVQVGGSVGSSLYEAVRRTGEPSALVSKLVELFAWDINFFTDTRPGDTFRVIVEKRYLGTKFYKYGSILAAEYRGKAGAVRVFWFESTDRAVFGYYTEHGENVVRGLLKTPLRYVRISSRYDPHRFHPILHQDRAHLGVDFAAPVGTPVWATAEGRVIFAGIKGGAGKLIALGHRNGLQSIYMHLSRIASNLRVGQLVRQKQVIGYVGSTGLATGPHLHFSLKKEGRYVDPMRVKVDRSAPLADRWRHDFVDLVGVTLPKLVAIEVVGPDPLAVRGPSPLP